MAKSVYVMHMYHQPRPVDPFADPTRPVPVTLDDDPGLPLSLQLDDHWWHILPGEPMEIESEFYADKLIEIYGPVYGIILVPTTQSRTGVSFDIDRAERMATHALNQMEDQMVMNYVRDQQDNRIRQNMSPLPPTGRVAEVVAKRRIDLKAQFNIDLKSVPSAAAALPPDLESARLRQENEVLRAQLAANASALDTILARMGRVEEMAGITDEDAQAAATNDKQKQQAAGQKGA